MPGLKLILLCLCLITPINAQVKNVTRLFTLTAKENTTVSSLDSDFTNLLQKRRETRDRLRWHTWQIITGPRSGGYTTGSFGHEWEDFNFEDLNNDVTGNLAKLMSGATLSDNGFYILRPALSRNPFSDDTTPPNFAEVRYYAINHGQELQFESLLLRVRELYEKTSQPRNYTVFRLVNGGVQGLFIIWVPLDKLSSLQYPDRGMLGVLDNELSGRNGTDSVTRVMSEILFYRPELSYSYRP